MARRRSVVRRAAGARGVTAGAVAAVLLLLGALAFLILRVGDGVRPAGDDVAAGAAGVATEPVRAGEGLFDRIAGMWSASGRIAALEAENTDLRAWRTLAERLAERNRRYEALLRMPPDSFGAGIDPATTIGAQLVVDSGGAFTRTFVANSGADHGVRVGFIVINEDGLIGRVVSVGAHSSRVLMLDDYNSRIPVMGESSRVRAVLVGQASEPPELLTVPFAMQAPRLDFIVGAANLRDGERVITSGDGGVFPRGLIVGVARIGSDGAWRVDLAGSQKPIDFVRILPYRPPDAPEASPARDPGPPPPRATDIADAIVAPAAAASPRAPAAPVAPAAPEPDANAEAPTPAPSADAPPQ